MSDKKTATEVGNHLVEAELDTVVGGTTTAPPTTTTPAPPSSSPSFLGKYLDQTTPQ